MSLATPRQHVAEELLLCSVFSVFCMDNEQMVSQPHTYAHAVANPPTRLLGRHNHMLRSFRPFKNNSRMFRVEASNGVGGEGEG